MFVSLFQTASGSWHLSSIFMASGWLLSSIITGFFIFANLKINRDERIKAYQKEQQNIIDLKDANTKLLNLEQKMKQKPIVDLLNGIIDGGDASGR